MGARDVRPFPDWGVDRIAGRGKGGRDLLRLLWIGTSYPRKGLPLALDAVAKARRRVEFEFVIAGGGVPTPVVEEWIRERELAETVRYLGRLPFSEMPELYATGDILLFTSLRDSLGTQLLEAAAAGLPTIAFDLHGVKTHVPSNASIKVPIELGADGIANAIVELASDDKRRMRMSDAALAFARKYTWAANAEAMEMIYLEAARR